MKLNISMEINLKKSIFRKENYVTNYKKYINNQTKRNYYSKTHFSFSPTQTTYYENLSTNNNNNKTSYSKFSFEKRLKQANENKKNIFNTKIINLENELKEKEEVLKANKIEIKKLNKKYYEDNKRLKEIRDLKLKVHNLIKEHHSHICNNYQNKIRFFNMRMLEYLNGKTFINQQIQFHKYFRFDLGDYESHSRQKMMTDINDIKKNTLYEEQLDFNKCFTEKEKKIIMRDVSYFIKDESKFKNLSFLTKKTLTQKLNEEDKKHKKKINENGKKKFNLKENKQCFSEGNRKKRKYILNEENQEKNVLNNLRIELNKEIYKNINEKLKEEKRIKKLDNDFKNLQKKISEIKKIKFVNPTIDFKKFIPSHNKREFLLTQNLNHLNIKIRPPNNYKNGANCAKHNKNVSIISFEGFDEETIQEKKHLVNCVNRITDIYKKDEIIQNIENEYNNHLKNFNNNNNDIINKKIKKIPFVNLSYDL